MPIFVATSPERILDNDITITVPVDNGSTLTRYSFNVMSSSIIGRPLLASLEPPLLLSSGRARIIIIMAVRACRIWNARSDSSRAHRLARRRNTGLRCSSSCQADQAIISITSTSRRRRPIFLARAQRHQKPAAAAPAVLPRHSCQCKN